MGRFFGPFGVGGPAISLRPTIARRISTWLPANEYV